jgi:putative phosphoribosyl transferase
VTSLIFKDRTDAGQKLAKKLEYLQKEEPIILAIPRGGVVTGDVIAKMLGASLDIVVPRKIGAPHNPELAIGAVMHDGSFFPNIAVIEYFDVRKDFIDEQIVEQLEEIERRLMHFRGRKEYNLKDKTIILVDDGVATGSTVFVTIDWLKKQRPKRIILATPVGSRDTIERLSKIIEVMVLQNPETFGAVGEFYEYFDQVDDSQVIKIMQNYGFKPIS